MPGCNLARSRFREADLSGADLEGADLTGADLFQAIVDEAKLAGADLRGAEVSGLDLRRLATYQDLKINPDQQFRLLDAMGTWTCRTRNSLVVPRSEVRICMGRAPGELRTR